MMSNDEKTRLRQVRRYQGAIEHTSKLANPPATTKRGTGLEISSSKLSSPDTTLTAFAQLVAWRLDARRAMVSLVGEDKQFFLAESTRTLALGAGEEAEDDNDGLWLGCGGTSREEALCSHTIEAPPVSDGYSFFCVDDLAAHPEFCNLPYVKGPPYSRFYAGTPLVTNTGYRIGSFLVLDDKPRNGLRPPEIDFLGIMASNVMKYLEAQHENEQRMRSMTMSKGLAAFVEGKSSIPEKWSSGPEFSPKNSFYTQQRQHKGSSLASLRQEDLADDLVDEETSTIDPKERLVRGNIERDEKDQSSSSGSNNGTPSDDYLKTSSKDAHSHRSILLRASNLLRQSLDVNYTVFLDSYTSHQHDESVISQKQSQTAQGINETRSENNGSKSNLHNSHGSSEWPLSEYSQLKSEVNLKHFEDHQEPVTVVGASFDTLSTPAENNSTSIRFGIITKRILGKLLKRYPKGNIWTLDEHGNATASDEDPLDLTDKSSSDEESTSEQPPKQRRTNLINDTQLFKNCFPGARQILYVPLPDARMASNTIACFAVSLHEVPVFTTDIEVSFARAFINNIAAEWDRENTRMADRQKAEFISSISHEFRSPLHGILASTELLSDSALESSQRSLCDTIDTCGRLLLHSISHILDYTKINNFKKSHPDRAGRNSSLALTTESAKSGGEEAQSHVSSLDILSTVDIALMCEDIVEVASASHCRDMQDLDLIASKILDSVLKSDASSQGNKRLVEVILNVASGEWNFSCIPGTIQRIMMNLVENSLKYTRKGQIKVKLEQDVEVLAEDNKSPGDRTMVILTVRDTGIGISEDFLRYKLYTPFSQESAVSSGTGKPCQMSCVLMGANLRQGLGLSIVKKIVSVLEGTISIRSVLGQGTEVIVRVPMNHAKGSKIPDVLPRTVDPYFRNQSSNVPTLRDNCSKKTLSIVGLTSNTDMSLRHSLELYISNWFGINLISDYQAADIIILDTNAVGVSSYTAENKKGSQIVIMIQNEGAESSSRYVQSSNEVISKPFGPYKLAKVLLTALHPSNELSAVIDDSNTVNDKVQELVVEPFSKASQKEPALDIHKTPMQTLPILSRSRADENRHLVAEKVRLDILSTHALPSSELKNLTQKTKDSIVHHGPRVLCVDDNGINLQLICAYMKKLNYKNIYRAEDGLQAFEIFKKSEFTFDLILMDITMPICDGFESTRMIRAFEQERDKAFLHAASSKKQQSHPVSEAAPVLAQVQPQRKAFIVALTGLASERDQNEAFAAGMNYFATKPMSLSHLRSLLSQWKQEGHIRGSNDACE